MLMRRVGLARAAAAAIVGLLTVGGAHSQTSAPPQTTTAATPTVKPKLVGSPVYVYSFLDVREDQMGADMLDDITDNLTAALTSAGVPNQLLRFRDSPEGKSWSPVAVSHTSDPVPVGPTIQSNLAAERSLGARYRLTALPKNLRQGRFLRSYAVTWTLIDCANDQVVWTHDYYGNDSFSVFGSGHLESSAEDMVDDLMAALKAEGWL